MRFDTIINSTISDALLHANIECSGYCENFCVTSITDAAISLWKCVSGEILDVNEERLSIAEMVAIVIAVLNENTNHKHTVAFSGVSLVGSEHITICSEQLLDKIREYVTTFVDKVKDEVIDIRELYNIKYHNKAIIGAALVSQKIGNIIND
jgi:hypothetical protein